MLSVGRLCVKTSGRDAGKKCAVVNVIDHTSVLIDGNVRRRRCNVRHLEPLSDVIDIKKDASHEEVESAFKKLKIHSSAPRVARRKKSSAGSKENEQKTGKIRRPRKMTDPGGVLSKSLRDFKNNPVAVVPVLFLVGFYFLMSGFIVLQFFVGLFLFENSGLSLATLFGVFFLLLDLALFIIIISYCDALQFGTIADAVSGKKNFIQAHASAREIPVWENSWF